MTKLTVDEGLRVKLQSLTVPVEFCDQSGRTLGHFVPSQPAQVQEALADCPYTEEELAAMRQEGGGRTLPEIWKSLGRR